MQKIIVRLTLRSHKNVERIFAFYDYNDGINKLIREIPGAKYSSTYKSWHLPVVKELVQLFAERVKEIAVLDLCELRQQLVAKKQLPVIVRKISHKPELSQLCTENIEAFERYIETLILKAYSPSTIRTYKNEFFQLLKELKKIPVSNLTCEHIRRYMYYCLDRYKLSEATANSRINAIKFYFEQVLGRERMLIELPRPKMPLILPKVLGENELSGLFRALTNLKHKAILFTAYSAGLRVSEVVKLQLKHVDSDRMQLFIEGAKVKRTDM
ncbi:phage integrase N-terminal SAM-like domain-containing protein [Segetibacter koreensis]|uniref:phage integrase N-terminal SAM-like domain-containing protein n=1 Tax=Segetibacter koreensis TaxID=398037 RepID=UPI0003A4652A